jgi:hypothetical protein
MSEVGEIGDLCLKQGQPFVLDKERGSVLHGQFACQRRLAGGGFPADEM